MKRNLAIVAAACILLCGRADWAHRIDEYLQATKITLKANEMQASMRLIPGVLVAPLVIAAIDSNQDGVFSESEKRAYAQRVLDDLSITIDGKAFSRISAPGNFPSRHRCGTDLGKFKSSMLWPCRRVAQIVR